MKRSLVISAVFFSFASVFAVSCANHDTEWTAGEERKEGEENLPGDTTEEEEGTTYTVRFNSNEGSAVPNQVVTAGALVMKPATPSKSGFIFDGWYKEDGNAWNFTLDTVSANLTLYAMWTELPSMGGNKTESGGFFDLTTLSSITASGIGWSYSELTLRVKNNSEVTITGGTTYINVVLSKGCGATVTLRDAIIDMSDKFNVCPLDLNDSSVVLILEGRNELISSGTQPGLLVSENARLRIEGNGILIVTGAESGSGGGTGIGSNEKSGEIEITSGTITATGGWERPGIGSAGIYGAGIISISGGNVTAQGGYHAAGIGGGLTNPGGTITITGGTVTAVGGDGGAGIGGGMAAGSAGGYGLLPGCTVVITGGDVTATGGDGAAGIGGGQNGTGGTITITGGKGRALGTGSSRGVGPGIGGTGGSLTTNTLAGVSFTEENPYDWNY